jgi:hypothetical protein
MIQKLLYSAGLMLVVFPSWGQGTVDLEGVEIDVLGIYSPEKVDRMPIVKPLPGYKSDMVITALQPDVQAKMPVYNDRPDVAVIPQLNHAHPALRYGEGRYGTLIPEGDKVDGLDLPKLGAPYSHFREDK